jgi:hypothetical protein
MWWPVYGGQIHMQDASDGSQFKFLKVQVSQVLCGRRSLREAQAIRCVP